MSDVEPFVGIFEGRGAWHDAAGKSATYRVRQINTANGEAFEFAFRHDFDDGAVVDARFTMTWIAPNLFRVDVSGAPVGNGYIFGAHCHYHLKMGDRYVEAGYRLSDDRLEVFGSSTTNAEGLYIAWTETLQRISP